MIMDQTGLFSSAQAITATAVSDNYIDLGATGTVYGAAAALTRDIGKGAEVPIKITVTQTFNNLTSLTVTIETDDNSSFSSATVIFTSRAYLLAELTAGGKYILPDESPVYTNERYVRLRYTVAGTAPSTGKITAGVTAGNQTNGTL